MTFMFAQCVLLLVLNHVSAIPWEGPRPTGVNDSDVGWTPLPTGTPNESPELVKRAGQYPITVCGFIGGDVGTVKFIHSMLDRNTDNGSWSSYTSNMLERIVVCVVLRLQCHWLLYDFGQCLHDANHLYR